MKRAGGRRGWPGRLAPIVGALLLALLLVQLGHWIAAGRNAEFVPRSDNTLRRWLGNDPDYLNPILRTSADSSYVFVYLHHSMLEWDFRKNELHPKLLTHYEISPDGRDYTFHLRRDVRWHDGERFDADDVLFSFRMAMHPDTPGYARGGYIDGWITDCLPAEDGDGQIAPAEYLELRLAELPELADEAAPDGAPRPGAAVVAESTLGSLLAARAGARLYLSAPIPPQRDVALFVAREPGEPVAYGPSAKVAAWDALLLYESGNHYPFPSGWRAAEGRPALRNADFAVSEDRIEGLLDLAELYPELEALPENLYVVAAFVDDVRLERLDDFTVRWHFPQRIYTNLAVAGGLRLVAEHYYSRPEVPLHDHPRRDIPLGLGPYRFVSWERNSRVRLERWPDYWGEPQPTVERIDFRIINDAVVAFQVFKKGDLDAMQVGVWTFQNIVQQPDFQRHFYARTFPRPSYSYIAWNHRLSFFKDRRCRQAMSHLLDAQAVADHMYQGLARQITGHFFFKEPGYDPQLPPYTYNIEKARALLDEAGWIDSDGDGIRDMDLDGDGEISHEPLDPEKMLRESFEFELLISGSIDAQNNWVALSLARNCEKVGIRCTIRNVEFALFLDWVKKRQFDAYSGAWVLSFESDPYEWFHSSQTQDGFNRQQYSDPEMDMLLEEARRELDPARRAELFRTVHRKMWEDQPFTFLLNFDQRWVFNRRVKNVQTYDLFFDVLEWQLEGHEPPGG